jgi:hypothetical protein
MLNPRIFLLLISFLFFGCQMPTVLYFSTDPFTTAYHVDIDKPLTIVIDSHIPDSFMIRTAGAKDMAVLQYRLTMEDALKNTFKSTYTEVNVDYKQGEKGLTLVLIKAHPFWEKKSSRTIVSGSGGNVNSRTTYELETKVNYQAVMYYEGEKLGVIEGTVFSEKSTFKREETPVVFQNGIKVMCEALYKQVVEYK